MYIKGKKSYTSKDLEKQFGVLTFGQALESHRLCEEMSLKKFAKMLGITPQSLCDLEKGRRIPSVERVVKIAKKLNEPVETWLSLSLSDMVRQANLHFEIEIKKRAS